MTEVEVDVLIDSRFWVIDDGRTCALATYLRRVMLVADNDDLYGPEDAA